MHIHNLFHGVGFWELDVVEEAAAQERVGQFLLIVRSDKHHRASFGFDQLTGFVAIKLHAINFTQQVIGKLDVGFVDLINQNGHRLIGGKGLPQHTLDDVVFDVLDFFIAELAVTQTADGVVFVQALLRFGG